MHSSVPSNPHFSLALLKRSTVHYTESFLASWSYLSEMVEPLQMTARSTSVSLSLSFLTSYMTSSRDFVGPIETTDLVNVEKVHVLLFQFLRVHLAAAVKHASRVQLA